MLLFKQAVKVHTALAKEPESRYLSTLPLTLQRTLDRIPFSTAKLYNDRFAFVILTVKLGMK